MRRFIWYPTCIIYDDFDFGSHFGFSAILEKNMSLKKRVVFFNHLHTTCDLYANFYEDQSSTLKENWSHQIGYRITQSITYSSATLTTSLRSDDKKSSTITKYLDSRHMLNSLSVNKNKQQQKNPESKILYSTDLIKKDCKQFQEYSFRV